MRSTSICIRLFFMSAIVPIAACVVALAAPGIVDGDALDGTVGGNPPCDTDDLGDADCPQAGGQPPCTDNRDSCAIVAPEDADWHCNNFSGNSDCESSTNCFNEKDDTLVQPCDPITAP